MSPPPHDEQVARQEFDQLVSLNMSIYWLKAVSYQGARIFEAATELPKHINSAAYNSRSAMEEQFFLIACAKAQRWLKPLNLRIPEADQFKALEDNIKKVRDEREHDEERYGLGSKFPTNEFDPQENAEKGFLLKRRKPNANQKFRMEKADTAGGVTIVGSMSGTVHSDGRILLGGIVDVAEIIAAAEALIAPLLEIQHASWEKRLSRRPGCADDRAADAESYCIEPRFDDDGGSENGL